MSFNFHPTGNTNSQSSPRCMSEAWSPGDLTAGVTYTVVDSAVGCGEGDQVIDDALECAQYLEFLYLEEPVMYYAPDASGADIYPGGCYRHDGLNQHGFKDSPTTKNSGFKAICRPQPAAPDPCEQIR